MLLLVRSRLVYCAVISLWIAEGKDMFGSCTADCCLRKANMNVLWWPDYYRLLRDGESIIGCALLL